MNDDFNGQVYKEVTDEELEDLIFSAQKDKVEVCEVFDLIAETGQLTGPQKESFDDDFRSGWYERIAHNEIVLWSLLELIKSRANFNFREGKPDTQKRDEIEAHYRFTQSKENNKKRQRHLRMKRLFGDKFDRNRVKYFQIDSE